MGRSDAALSPKCYHAGTSRGLLATIMTEYCCLFGEGK